MPYLPNLNNASFMPVMEVADYIKVISKMANDTDENLQKIAFKLFDVDRVDKITEKGLFSFMQYTTT